MANAAVVSTLAMMLLLSMKTSNNGVAGYILTLYSDSNYGGESCSYWSGGQGAPGFVVQSYIFDDPGNRCLFTMCSGRSYVGELHSTYQDPNGGGFDNVRMACGEGFNLDCGDGPQPQIVCS